MRKEENIHKYVFFSYVLYADLPPYIFKVFLTGHPNAI